MVNGHGFCPMPVANGGRPLPVRLRGRFDGWRVVFFACALSLRVSVSNGAVMPRAGPGSSMAMGQRRSERPWHGKVDIAPMNCPPTPISGGCVVVRLCYWKVCKPCATAFSLDARVEVFVCWFRGFVSVGMRGGLVSRGRGLRVCCVRWGARSSVVFLGF